MSSRYGLRRLTAAAVVFLLPLLACGDESTGPSVEAVAGTYVATTLTATSAGTVTDYLAEGAALELTLASDRSVTGTLFIPGGAEGGGDLDVSMAGTWSLRDGVVRFTQDGDTFVRDVPFRADGSSLRGDVTFGSTRVRVVLERQ